MSPSSELKWDSFLCLDRLTGKPVFPVEERPVPASEVKGEQSWPTQPFPILPAPLGIQKIDSTDSWGVNENLRAESVQKIKAYQNKGIYTPPSYQGSLMTPGNIGGIHWGGMCYDDVQWFADHEYQPASRHHYPCAEGKHEEEEIKKERQKLEVGRQLGTPYLLKRDYLIKINEDGINILSKPPWGAVDRDRPEYRKK